MVIRMLYKNSLIKIRKSFGRYLSIFIIVMIGVGFYAGIQASGPDIKKVADRYYHNQNLMDFKIVSTMGLTDNDVNAIKNINGVLDAVPSYSLDVLSKQKAIRVHAIEKKVNKVRLTAGRMPQKENECVADGKTYRLGDKINITSDVNDKLNNKKYTVVGLMQSVLYITKDYGSTTIGNGKLSSYIFVNKSNFNIPAYTEIDVIAKDTQSVVAYTDKYKQIASELNDKLIKIKPDREKARYVEIYNKANLKIGKNENKLYDKKSKAAKKLNDAKIELDKNSNKLKDAKAELLENDKKLDKTVKKQTDFFKSSKKKISDGWNKIDSSLKASGIKREQVSTKINELDTAIKGMKTQLAGMSADNPQYAQLSAMIKEYSVKLAGLNQLNSSINTLTSQEKQLNAGIRKFNSKIQNAKKKIVDGKTKLAKNEKKLRDGYDEYQKNLNKFNDKMSDADTKISEAKSELNKLKYPKWYISDRDTVVGYTQLEGGTQIIESVASIIPVFFILIVILMTSNSMARMIAEERGELGTLTSLGYHDKNIVSTYLLYVLSASGLGAIIGFFIGSKIIPPLIYITFPYVMPPLVIHYDIILLFIILAVTLILMSLVTVVGCNRELKQEPASLLRPLPPKHGQKILLERFGFIWKRLSFIWKITMRNMFRYKKRAIMTIVGVSFCTSFLVVGFGLRDSMDGVAEKQYGDIFHYSNMIILKNEIHSITGDLKNIINKEKLINPLAIRQSAVKCENDDRSLDVYLIVPQDDTKFNTYYHLTDLKNKKNINLNDSGVIITQRIAKEFNVKKGGIITIKDSDNNIHLLNVHEVAENYMSSYIYMKPSLYNNVFGKPANYNAIVSNSNNSTNETELAQHLIKSGKTVNVIFTSDLMKKAIENNNSLNSIIFLVVVVASMLAIIVLYNLTSINISERTREIATLKVLGFRDGETNTYIYREAIVLTLISIGIGLILGVFLHSLVLNIIEGDFMALLKRIKWSSFVVSGLLTLIFSFIMELITYFKLKKINMIESLKSVE